MGNTVQYNRMHYYTTTHFPELQETNSSLGYWLRVYHMQHVFCNILCMVYNVSYNSKCYIAKKQ